MLDALFLLAACEESYDNPTITGGPGGRDGALVRQLPGGGTLLVFRGTITTGEAGFLDWLNDLRAELIEHPAYFGKVHKGFAASLDDLWPKLPELKPPLTISGHSKGGSLAVMALSRLLKQSPSWHASLPSVLTLAAAMPGDYTFSACCDPFGLVRRYENPHDIVPRLPPFDYWPVGTLTSAPSSWAAPHGVAANHHLETGYKPWIAELAQAA